MNLYENDSCLRQNSACIDAFSCTFHAVTPEVLIQDILHLEQLDWQYRDYGRYGYKESLQFGSISILYHGRLDSMGICLEMRGQGCAELRQLTRSDSIFYTILNHPAATLTRIDIAIDDHAGLIDMKTVVEKIEHGEIRTRMRATTECKGLADTTGHTVYIGSASSNCRVRIYDKQAQMETAFSWVRTEMVLRHEDAVKFQTLVKTIEPGSSSHDDQIVARGISVLLDKLSFIELDDINISRCSVSSWWEELLETEPIHLTGLSKKIPSIENAAEWLRKQAAPTLVLLLCILGVEWYESLIQDGILHMDNARAITWLQQMKALEMTPTVNPLDEHAFQKIKIVLGEHFNP